MFWVTCGLLHVIVLYCNINCVQHDLFSFAAKKYIAMIRKPFAFKPIIIWMTRNAA